MKRIHHVPDGRKITSEVNEHQALVETWGALEAGVDVGGTWSGSDDGGCVIALQFSPGEVVELYLPD